MLHILSSEYFVDALFDINSLNWKKNVHFNPYKKNYGRRLRFIVSLTLNVISVFRPKKNCDIRLLKEGNLRYHHVATSCTLLNLTRIEIGNLILDIPLERATTTLIFLPKRGWPHPIIWLICIHFGSFSSFCLGCIREFQRNKGL